MENKAQLSTLSCTASYNKNYCSNSKSIVVTILSVPDFYPIFQTVDSLTEERSIYAKPYTLRAVAGGTRPNTMKFFNRNESM